MGIYRFRNRSHRLISDMGQGLFFALLAGFFITGAAQAQTAESSFQPRSVITIEHIQPFELEQSYDYGWRRDQSAVRSGLLVVLRVDPDLVTPRNELEPVLYAGNHTVQRLNSGHESGFVLGIIPEQINLSEEPVWFGAPDLPERIDANVIASERRSADRSGIVPLAAAEIQIRTQALVVVPDLNALLRNQAADLLLAFSPQEKRLADAWRLPVTGQDKQR